MTTETCTVNSKAFPINFTTKQKKPSPYSEEGTQNTKLMKQNQPNTQTEIVKQQKPRSKLLAKPPQQAEPSKPKILIYGKPGVGKTWTSLEFPSVYYIDTEGGANLSHYTAKLAAAGGVYMGVSEGSLDFKTVIDQIKALATEDHEFKTVVFDSISKLYNTAIADEAARLGDKDAFGASKKPAIAHMRQLVNWLNRIDMNVILISHERTAWGLDKNGDRAEIGVTFDAWDKLEYELHLALNITKRGDLRQAKVTKSRLPEFPDNSFFPWSFQDFSKKFGETIIGSTSKKIVLASSEDIAEVKRLLEIVKIPEETITKWHTAASVTDWNEMSEEQIKKVLLFLTSKLK